MTQWQLFKIRLSAVWLAFGRWFKAVMIGVDDTGAAIVFRDQTDLTISARCGMAEIDQMRGTVTLSDEEMDALLNLAGVLNRIQAHHCRGAILGDIARAQAVIDKLTPYANYMAANNLPTA